MSRPVDRIVPFLEYLEALWLKHPDMRFHQLVNYIAGGSNRFYMEDDVTLEMIAKLLEEKDV